MAGMGIGEAALLSAAIGGGTSAIQGKDPLKGALLGGIGGAALGGLGGALGSAGGAAGTAGAEALGAGISGSVQPALAAGQTYSAMGNVIPAATAAGASTGPMLEAASAAPSLLSSPTAWWQSLTPTQKMLYGGGAGLGLMALSNRRSNMPGQDTYTGPLSRFQYNPDTYRPAFQMAGGGIAGLSGDTPRPQQVDPVMFMRNGGISSLGAYSDGGRLLKGPGDGMSDNIPATIANKQPARLADGEFVVPADVVSHLGNGSTDAGAKQLYKMMDKVRQKRTGNKKQGRQINPEQFLPA